MYLVVSYDIHDDKRRNRVHKLLKNFGERIQFSVFECDLTKEELLRMQHALNRIIKEEDQDSVRFYHLCDSCQRKIDRIGGIIPREDGPVVVEDWLEMFLFLPSWPSIEAGRKFLGDARK